MAQLCCATSASTAEDLIREDERGDEEEWDRKEGTAKCLSCRQKIFEQPG